MKIATYHRVSTVDQNPDAARTELRAFAERMGGAIALEIEETGSGARNDRPGLRRVLEAARKREIDCLLVWKLDRLGRSVLDLQTNANDLHAWGVRLACVTQPIDTGTSTGKLVFAVLAAIAEFERDTIRERTVMGLRHAKKRGKQLGRKRLKLPDFEAVKKLKYAGSGCRKIAKTLKCSEWAARSVLQQIERIDAAILAD